MTATKQTEVDRPSADDFGRFFHEAHGHSPFPWQENLLRRVAERGWPELVDVPTGLGKTAVLDVAVFLSAMSSEHARRRVFLVVDRRLIVDQAYNSALEIRQALDEAQRGTASDLVRRALSVTGDAPSSSLDVTRMRGGVNWSWLWLERPDRHAIITGTVDQIGSRLFFRGYGVGEQLRPIDAALVGTDSLIIVDEAHLSDPLLTTLREALALNAGAVGASPTVVAMSASPEHGCSDVHGITAADENHPVARRRLRAAKSLHPVVVGSSGASAAAATADALAYWARQLGGPGRVTGVVANTVAMARAVFDRLSGESPEEKSCCVLLTGRVRPVDREYLLATWYPRIRSFANRDPEAELYVVATQTIEAGADVDFDGLVTQSASLPATVQRLGRLNRLGERSDSHAIVVHPGKLPDLVYGPARDRTWEWLTNQAEAKVHGKGISVQDLNEISASPADLRAAVGAISGADRLAMHGDRPYVPVLSEPTVGVWARTSPAPHPDVPVAPYLHGIGLGEPTVSVVWRADLVGDDPRNWADSVERLPVTADEAIEIPISAVRRWLSAVNAADDARRFQVDARISDLESQPAEEDGMTQADAATLRVLRVGGANKAEPVSARGVRPGDVLLVKSSWGGCDRYGWNPGPAAKVVDVADFAGGRKGNVAIRIGKPLVEAVQILAPDLAPQIASFVAEVKSGLDDESVTSADCRRRISQMIGNEAAEVPHIRVLRRLSGSGELIELDPDPDDGQQAVEQPDPIFALFAARGTSWSDDDSPAGSSVSGKRKAIILAAHQRAVRKRAGEFAGNLGLAPELCRAVRLAALFHDEGKRDERFQIMLHRGDRWLAQAATEPLAKSGMNPADRAAMRRAARASGYPSGMRHEAFSAQAAEILLARGVIGCEDTDGEFDQDLVTHLIAAHHGFGRPLLPPLTDTNPQQIAVPGNGDPQVTISTANSVDWNGPARFISLCEKYGWWGLAYLETVVRLADIWCSARSEEIHDQDS
jgi:CRISPR-associated endonuclease/helicase Cas3